MIALLSRIPFLVSGFFLFPRSPDENYGSGGEDFRTKFYRVIMYAQLNVLYQRSLAICMTE